MVGRSGIDRCPSIAPIGRFEDDAVVSHHQTRLRVAKIDRGEPLNGSGIEPRPRGTPIGGFKDGAELSSRPARLMVHERHFVQMVPLRQGILPSPTIARGKTLCGCLGQRPKADEQPK